MRGSHPVSSSRIRNSILEGRLEDAAAMLGREYSLALEGEWIGEADVWTARVAAGSVLPPDGWYSVQERGGGDRAQALLRGGSIVYSSRDPRGIRELAIIDSVARE